jgi:uncharacterized protein involved in exopolysaccharide biosynthesis
MAPGMLREAKISPGTLDRTPEQDDTFEISLYLRALGRRWQLVAVGAVVGLAGALAVITTRPVLHEGVTTVFVAPALKPNAAQINPTTFQALVASTSLAAQVIQEMGLERPPHLLTPLSFVARALSVEQLRGTNVIKVRVRLADAARAADASKSLTRKAILLTQQLEARDVAAVQEQRKSQLTVASIRLKAAEDALISYQKRTTVRDPRRRQIEEARLQDVVDRARDAHTDMAVLYEESRAGVVGTVAQIQVIDEAIPPDRPLSRHTTMWLALGLVTGLLAACLGAVALESRSRIGRVFS